MVAESANAICDASKVSPIANLRILIFTKTPITKVNVTVRNWLQSLRHAQLPFNYHCAQENDQNRHCHLSERPKMSVREPSLAASGTLPPKGAGMGLAKHSSKYRINKL